MVRAVYFIADQPPNGHRVDGYYSDSAPVEYVNATRRIGGVRAHFDIFQICKNMGNLGGESANTTPPPTRGNNMPPTLTHAPYIL